MIDPVQAQYEAYPYPARDPEAERRRLVVGSPSHLAEVNHYLFAGRRDFRQPFRALIAGGGTGDAAIMLAQQLSDEGGPSEVLHLDLSAAAQEVAQARASVRGLTNLRFRQGSLLDLEGQADFDYVDCCGVLHHLEDPAAGLAALARHLAPGGGMGLMLYGELGRRGVYETQAMLRQLRAGRPLADGLATARRLLAALPPSHWLKRNPMVGDHARSDAELVDLLLHACDRAFSVEEIAALVEGAGLRLVSFIEPARYEPSTFLGDQDLLARLEGLMPLERAAFAEKLLGSMKTHVFYVTAAQGRTRAMLEGPTSIPVLPGDDGAALGAALRRDGGLEINLGGLTTRLVLPPAAAALLEAIDGRRDLAALHNGLVAADPSLSWDAFLAEFRQLYGRLGPLNKLLLRHPL